MIITICLAACLYFFPEILLILKSKLIYIDAYDLQYIHCNVSKCVTSYIVNLDIIAYIAYFFPEILLILKSKLIYIGAYDLQYIHCNVSKCAMSYIVNLGIIANMQDSYF